MNKVSPHKKRRRVLSAVIAFALDIIIAGAIVGGDYAYTYKFPHQLASANIITADPSSNNDGQSGNGTYTSADGTSNVSDWGEKFKDHFSDTIVSTDTVYKSPNISIEITHQRYDSGIVDHSASGKHVKYGSNISYTLADIYIRDISCFQTAFAKDTYGVGYSETLSSMSERIKSILAVNGDSYSNSHHRNNGTIIRNGIAYRTQPSTEETCVLFRDGTMKIYMPDTFDPNQAIADGAWQSWVFGPSLLDENGNAKTKFLTWDYITESHPRTAIGYYEPGHYCLLVVDGREPNKSRGMFLEEMSLLFENLGCKAAYNLDGGHSSFMTLGADVISDPYRPNKDTSDGIFICEPEGNS